MSFKRDLAAIQADPLLLEPNSDFLNYCIDRLREVICLISHMTFLIVFYLKEGSLTQVIGSRTTMQKVPACMPFKRYCLVRAAQDTLNKDVTGDKNTHLPRTLEYLGTGRLFPSQRPKTTNAELPFLGVHWRTHSSMIMLLGLLFPHIETCLRVGGVLPSRTLNFFFFCQCSNPPVDNKITQ